MKNHQFVTTGKGGRKGRRGQTKKVRKGSRFPGRNGLQFQGSVRHPF